jgi:hypothetical protein
MRLDGYIIRGSLREQRVSDEAFPAGWIIADNLAKSEPTRLRRQRLFLSAKML